MEVNFLQLLNTSFIHCLSLLLRLLLYLNSGLTSRDVVDMVRQL
jgi:hypothetical protein